MRFSVRHPLVAILLIVLISAIVAPLLLRQESVVMRPLDMELPAVPELPTPDALPPVSTSEIELAEQAINDAREQLRGGSAKPSQNDPLPVPAAWAVQVAVLETEQQAQAEKQRLLDSGYRGYLRMLPENQGWQLFAGPELERAAAQATLERLKIDPQWSIETDIQTPIVPFSP
ncbi:SPOR domain-containing protein [Alcanivorax sp. 1008]|uniref:SPOR domain-containing protein n=1 Tax=Alcanivorax sp. 1008 TaxID=2816853 RepID=UPI001DCFA0F4|nr:SPOR domain-containing protein [Alcanivorax sp. 1008]MCC1496330.1 SPOR domain-containing protein [Alcanivorax sp. 1008]